jgi:hypothetical protein
VTGRFTEALRLRQQILNLDDRILQLAYRLLDHLEETAHGQVVLHVDGFPLWQEIDRLRAQASALRDEEAGL